MTTKRTKLYLKNLTTKRTFSVVLDVNYHPNRVEIAGLTGGHKPRRTWFVDHEHLFRAVLRVNNAAIVKI